MLARTNRFHGYKSLNFAYRNGKTVREPRLNLRYAINPRSKSLRVAVVVSRKVNKSAVKRNRIRRRIYDIISRQQISGNYDLIFSVYSDELAEIEFTELEALVKGQLKRAGITLVPRAK